jgi:hypothetical protein
LTTSFTLQTSSFNHLSYGPLIPIAKVEQQQQARCDRQWDEIVQVYGWQRIHEHHAGKQHTECHGHHLNQDSSVNRG